ncbi:MAG: phosphopantothenate--cysteine ligase [Peptostreptococcaceae bacterium]|nr:phosphopantothenate--cysteine ligase [Peptostreptococcaceae bacterium]
MKLIITAGGTTEKIDDVRSITNLSTGRLGNAIARSVLRNFGEKLEKLYYIHGTRAISPSGPNVVSISIGGVSELETVLKEILEKEKIDAVIHSMAVSDYTVKELTTLEDVKEGKTLDASKKISSDIENLVIVMKKTPKVISSIKKWSPNTLLVGFKLLSHVPKEELMAVGHALLLKNGCDFVLANDLEDIKEKTHKGFLIHQDKTFDIMETKEEIGETISKRLLEKLSDRSGESTGEK